MISSPADDLMAGFRSTMHRRCEEARRQLLDEDSMTQGLAAKEDRLDETMRLSNRGRGCARRRLLIILAGSKYRFTLEITSCFLRPTDPLLNNWFKVQPLNLNPFRATKKVRPLVQDLDSVLKGTTYLLSQKWVGANSVLHPMFLATHSILSMKWEAYWASDEELPSPIQI
ncbi:hypothetical protein E6C27_scaffold219G001490 [Cucumis melo var. makuwa]|uniref:Uncharacterized protein n=2 Tax=Cucumis melo TaxID=3656 RepID=A0A5A7SRX7_CUCMM|nr:hypothetical protein E6C27_scaffold219G001490 [Cucumis melo var. makuwa]